MTDSAPNNVTWATGVLRRHTPLFLSFYISGQTRERIQRETGLPIQFTHLRRSGLALQFSQEELAAARRIVHRQVTDSGLHFFDEFSNRCLASCHALLHTAETVGAQPLPPSGDGPEFETLLFPYFDAAIAQTTMLRTMVLVHLELEAFLEEFVTTRATKGHRAAAAVIDALKTAVEPTNEILNLLGLLELGQVIQSEIVDYREWITADPTRLLVRIANDYPNFWERITKYETEYGWMGRMYYAGHPISAADIVLRIQTILRYDCAERLARISLRHKEQLANRRDAIGYLNDPQAELLGNIFARYIHLRSKRLDVLFIAHERVVEALGAAGLALGLARPDDIIYLDWREIILALRETSSATELRAITDARRNGFEFVANAGATKWMTTTVEPQTPVVAQPTVPDADIVGVTACGGRVQGIVRLVLSDRDMLDMIPGEILVTTNTTPSAMIAVEKAAAIVTDEGGMLSHAAIVSREFDIPCVIATKDATRRLRTGDTIDVLADEGKIQVISRVA